ncbi:mycofactocin system GMC family oxidoreductase MftG [Gordonia crocea]|uniref:Dehydrogenase n=1 Tax=Gordonia crocea TaxID=589162 RepID=A0A7I9V2H2_9ACTN|nr:mycofactocin system GMC family oxidoreductase MftG [Gordonia crocea]GED99392.1 dehydrogenase [Gordonia crocea]
MVSDVLVVGAGSAGCVVAERLSRNRSVVLLEAGGWPTGDALRADRMVLGSPGSPSGLARWYGAAPPVVRGRAVGGSSVVNGGYFLRTRRSDFDGWGAPFTALAIEAAYDELDGGARGGTMTVRRLDDEEVPPVTCALESYWDTVDLDPWPGIGAQRVPVNGGGVTRRTAAQAYLEPARGRASLTVRAQSPVAGLVVERGRVVGVVAADGEELRAGEVVVCAGTLGTAELLMAAGVVRTPLPVYEHREVLVRYAARENSHCPVLLPSVVHHDDVEIRCYADDFAAFITGLAATGPAVGVAEMVPAQAGSLSLGDGGLQVELAPIGEVGGAVDGVVAALSSSGLADLVVDGSVRVDPVVGTSQHAWGSLPMGQRTDWLGAVDGVPGLRVVDGSILPKVSSGPHATIMMAAIVIADALR